MWRSASSLALLAVVLTGCTGASGDDNYFFGCTEPDRAGACTEEGACVACITCEAGPRYCSCLDGQWAALEFGEEVGSPCPAVPPTPGDECQPGCPSPRTCDYLEACPSGDATHVRCEAGQWLVTSAACP